jgi:hypothetical protein
LKTHLDKLQVRKVNTKTRNRYIEIVKENTGEQNDEAYILNVSPDTRTILIKALTPKGALHGVQSLISIIEGHDGPLHKLVIIDKPR